MGKKCTTVTPDTTEKTSGRTGERPRTLGGRLRRRGRILGPAAVTAYALDQANAAPMHHAVRVDQTQAYIPADTTRRRATAGV